MSASQTEELMNDILQGNVHLQPLNDISNMPNNVISRTKLAPVQSGIETSIVNDNNSMANLAPGQSGTAKNPGPCSLMFHSCTVTINMAQEYTKVLHLNILKVFFQLLLLKVKS